MMQCTVLCAQFHVRIECHPWCMPMVRMGLANDPSSAGCPSVFNQSINQPINVITRLAKDPSNAGSIGVDEATRALDLHRDAHPHLLHPQPIDPSPKRPTQHAAALVSLWSL